jgi:hypothetical protein
MSFKPMVKVNGEWAGNALRFASYNEAMASAENLMNRWLLVEECRADKSEDPVNFQWNFDWKSGGQQLVEVG